MAARAALVLPFTLLCAGCAALQGFDPLEVNVAGIEPLQGQGMELRMLVKLRVQNPNDAPINYNGVALAMDVQGKKFASGVSDANGVVPRFGEAVIAVPVTISAFNIVRQTMAMADQTPERQISYEMRGKLSGAGFGSKRFATKGELELPAAASAPE